MCRLWRVACDGSFGKIDTPFLATRALKISEATLLRETVVGVILKILQHMMKLARQYCL